MEYYFAPLEGITGAVFREAHDRCFGGVDAYYMPFLSPTRDRVFTPRDLRNVAPEHNLGFRGVPQLLTREPEDFCWAANALYDMGYDEVNLNLGCPSGTVTAKGKGAGLLADPDGLERLLEGIFAGARGKVSVKTRLGMNDPEEFPRLLELFSRYPLSMLILHPRVRADFYKGPIRMEWFRYAADHYRGSLCYNGGLVTPEDCAHFQREYPAISRVMIGRGLLADPALARKMKGGLPASREELRDFHEQLYRRYLELFSGVRNTVFHMKELWSYLYRLFEGGGKLFKQIKKAQDGAAYESAVEQIFRTLPLREDADWSQP